MAAIRFLASVSALGLAGIAESANCYKVDGKLQDTKYGWKPCNPDAAASPCCSAIDYCLDNGLCLNAGVVNNYITVQGCTDPTWGGSCRKYCAGSMDSNGYVGITICDGSNNACCGDKGTCCSGETFPLPFFTNLKHPPKSESTSQDSTTTTTPLALPTSSGTGSPSQTPKTSSPGAPTSSDPAAAANSDQVLKVGLGVGLPLGLLLLAIIAYLIWELRKRKAVAGDMKTMAYQTPDNVNVVLAQQMATPRYQENPQRYLSELPVESERGELGLSPRG
ncbi:hypothetical protein B0H67DRAFT_350426 [Lasiosphaeris hirsuta]|uniref:Uncharacterized protein n=1 Tax=Lasiosphaeris hirsuta TaxID=260670 RepID=A0AA40DKB5_9PEZI|nr:hypothetical protein B0H67DRAFT_350426 [Lasiosphaeris hirsuta]